MFRKVTNFNFAKLGQFMMFFSVKVTLAFMIYNRSYPKASTLTNELSFTYLGCV